MDGPVTSIKEMGGFARSELWRQMLADIFDEDVIVPESYESSSLGACILGLYALGKIESFNVVEDIIGDTHKHELIVANFYEYQKCINSFLNLYITLTNVYK